MATNPLLKDCFSSFSKLFYAGIVSLGASSASQADQLEYSPGMKMPDYVNGTIHGPVALVLENGTCSSMLRDYYDQSTGELRFTVAQSWLSETFALFHHETGVLLVDNKNEPDGIIDQVVSDISPDEILRMGIVDMLPYHHTLDCQVLKPS